MIRPDLRDLINKHKPIEELNNNNNNNNIVIIIIIIIIIIIMTNNKNDIDRGESRKQLSMIISCIFTRGFKDKRTIHSKSEAVEVSMGSDTKNVIDTLFNTLAQYFQHAQETSNERGSELFLIGLNY